MATVSHATQHPSGSDSGDGKVSKNAWNEGHQITGDVDTFSGNVLLAERTASASATLDLTSVIGSDFDEYVLEFLGVYGAGATPVLLVSTDNGATWASANYMWTQWIWGAGDIQYYSSSDTGWNLTNFSDVAPDVNRAINGQLRLYLPSGGYAMLDGGLSWGRTTDGAMHAATARVVGRYDSATNPNALRFKFSSGSIAAGKIRIYGVPKTVVLLPRPPAGVAGLRTWLDASQITGLSDGAALTTWPNVAPGGGNDAVAIGSSPTYETNELNGLPIVRLGGGVYFRMFSEALRAQGHTIFLVCKFTSLSPAYTGVVDYGSHWADWGAYLMKSNGKSADYVFYVPGSAYADYDGTGSSTFTTGTWNYITIAHGRTIETRRNGSTDATGTAITYGHSNPGHSLLGAQYNAGRVMVGDVAEYLIYDRELSSTDRNAVEAYLVAKYAL